MGMRPSQECVGMLLGKHRYAMSAVRLLNSSGEPGAFRLETFEVVRATQYAARQGQQIVALYHTHPSGSLTLSQGDRRALAKSRWPWIIVTLQDGELRCCGYSAETCQHIRVVLE
jgi:Predicted metal-dependent protease of the PAD1/JAB1 superfamily